MRPGIQQGQSTGAFGRWLTDYLKASRQYKDYQVYYDHGDRQAGANVVAIKGFLGDSVTNRNRLADVDVMIVAPNKSIRLLIEIEERPSSPKKILGDVLACIICSRFAVRLDEEQQYFDVTGDTELIVAGIVPSSGGRLMKIEQIILPRIGQLSGLSDGIRPSKVGLIFSDNIGSTIDRVEDIIKKMFPQK